MLYKLIQRSLRIQLRAVAQLDASSSHHLLETDAGRGLQLLAGKGARTILLEDRREHCALPAHRLHCFPVEIHVPDVQAHRVQANVVHCGEVGIAIGHDLDQQMRETSCKPGNVISYQTELLATKQLPAHQVALHQTAAEVKQHGWLALAEQCSRRAVHLHELIPRWSRCFVAVLSQNNGIIQATQAG